MGLQLIGLEAPSIIFLDEPTSGLDSHQALQVGGVWLHRGCKKYCMRQIQSGLVFGLMSCGPCGVGISKRKSSFDTTFDETKIKSVHTISIVDTVVDMIFRKFDISMQRNNRNGSGQVGPCRGSGMSCESSAPVPNGPGRVEKTDQSVIGPTKPKPDDDRHPLRLL